MQQIPEKTLSSLTIEIVDKARELLALIRQFEEIADSINKFDLKQSTLVLWYGSDKRMASSALTINKGD